MFTVDKNSEITKELLLAAIKHNETQVRRYAKLGDYYLGQHDILKRAKDYFVSNNKLVINYAKYIVDTNIGYLLGNPIEYQASDGIEIKNVLDAYKKQTINDLDSEIAKGSAIFGAQYEYIYADEESNPKSAKIDVRNAVVIYDNTIEHKKMYGVIYSPVYKISSNDVEYYSVLVVDKTKVYQFNLSDKLFKKVEGPLPHAFGDVPLVEYRNNPERQGDFEQVITLIDAYNTLQSDRINDKEQLVDAILCLYGMDMDDNQRQMLMDSRVLGGIPEDAKAEYLTKSLNEGEVDILRKNIESDIHKISMTPNMSDENFVGNSSGVAIRYKLLAFEQNIKNKQRYMEKGLVERFRLYNQFLSTRSGMKIVPVEEVDVVFKRNLPSNDLETSQVILNLMDLVDKETLVGQLSFIKDAKEVVQLKEKENNDINDPGYNDNQINDANDNSGS